MVTLPLRGYVFFGSAVRVLKAVKETVLKNHVDARGRAFHLAVLSEEEEEDDGDGGSSSSSGGEARAASEPGEEGGAPPPPLVSPSARGAGPRSSSTLPHVRSDPRLVPPPCASPAAAAAAAGAGGGGGGSPGVVQRESSVGSSVSSHSQHHHQHQHHPRSLPHSRRPRSQEVRPGSVRASSLMTPVYNRGGTWVEYEELGTARAAAAAVGGGAWDEEMGHGGSSTDDDDDDDDDDDQEEEEEEEEEELQGLLGEAMDVGQGQAGLLLMTRSRSSHSRRSNASSNMSTCFSCHVLMSDVARANHQPNLIIPPP